MDQLRKSIEKLLSDNTSGSGELLHSLIQSLNQLASRRGKDVPIDAGIIREQLLRIQEEKPVFLVLQHFTGRFLEETGKNRALTAENISRFLSDYTTRWSNVTESIWNRLQQVADLSGRTVLLHSNSSTIYGIFREAAAHSIPIKIIQTESRPVMEGRLQASRLAELGFNVTLITDAGISRHMEQADLSILGADAVYPQQFINKTGSRSIALACREYGKPCLVVCDSRKLWLNQEAGTGIDDFDIPAPACELWDDPPGKLNIENFYFEQIPNLLVSRFVFEDEIIEGNKIEDIVR